MPPLATSSGSSSPVSTSGAPTLVRHTCCRWSMVTVAIGAQRGGAERAGVVDEKVEPTAPAELGEQVRAVRRHR